MYRYWQIPKKTPRDIVLGQYNDNYKLLEKKLIENVEKAGGRYDFATLPKPEKSEFVERETNYGKDETYLETMQPSEKISSTEDSLLKSSSRSESLVSREDMDMTKYETDMTKRNYTDIIKTLENILRGDLDNTKVETVKNIVEGLIGKIFEFEHLYNSNLDKDKNYNLALEDLTRFMDGIKNESTYVFNQLADKKQFIDQLRRDYMNAFSKVWKLAPPGSGIEITSLGRDISNIFRWVFTQCEVILMKRLEKIAVAFDGVADNSTVDRTFCTILLIENPDTRVKYFKSRMDTSELTDQLKGTPFSPKDPLEHMINLCTDLFVRTLLIDIEAFPQYEAKDKEDNYFDSLYSNSSLDNKRENKIISVLWPAIITNYGIFKGKAYKESDFELLKKKEEKRVEAEKKEKDKKERERLAQLEKEKREREEKEKDRKEKGQLALFKKEEEKNRSDDEANKLVNIDLANENLGSFSQDEVSNMRNISGQINYYGFLINDQKDERQKLTDSLKDVNIDNADEVNKILQDIENVRDTIKSYQNQKKTYHDQLSGMLDASSKIDNEEEGEFHEAKENIEEGDSSANISDPSTEEKTEGRSRSPELVQTLSNVSTETEQTNLKVSNPPGASVTEAVVSTQPGNQTTTVTTSSQPSSTETTIVESSGSQTTGEFTSAQGSPTDSSNSTGDQTGNVSQAIATPIMTTQTVTPQPGDSEQK